MVSSLAHSTTQYGLKYRQFFILKWERKLSWNKINPIFMTQVSLLTGSIGQIINFKKHFFPIFKTTIFITKMKNDLVLKRSGERCFSILKEYRLKITWIIYFRLASMRHTSNHVDVNIMQNNIIIPIKYLFSGRNGDDRVVSLIECPRIRLRILNKHKKYYPTFPAMCRMSLYFIRDRSTVNDGKYTAH